MMPLGCLFYCLIPMYLTDNVVFSNYILHYCIFVGLNLLNLPFWQLSDNFFHTFHISLLRVFLLILKVPFAKSPQV